MLNLNNSDSNNVVNISFGDKGFFFNNNVFKDRSGVCEIAISVVFVVSFLLSVVGNVCTCVVIIQDRSMRTPTNYYLLNLAVADLMTAMFIPIEIIVLWIPDVFGKITGHLVLLFWDLLCNCSVLTILALTIERYIVISKPFLRHTFVLSSRVIKILAVNWTIAATFCILNVFHIYNIEEHTSVYIYFNSQPSSHVIFLMAAEIMIFFIFPMFVISMLYGLIMLRLKTKQAFPQSPAFANQNRSKAIKMLAAVAASFFICWSPYCMLRIMIIVPQFRQKNYINYWHILCYLNGINSYASTAVNPILYSLMSQKFRRAFKELLKGRNIALQPTTPGLRVNISSNKNLHGTPETNLKLHHLHNGNFSFG